MLTIAIAMLKVKVSTISIIRKKSLTTLLATIIVCKTIIAKKEM